MRVVCAYVPGRLRRGTVDALVAQAPHTEFVDVSAAVDSYYDLFADLWRARQDFLLVEHDIMLAPGTVDALERCPEPWCACPIGVTYRMTGSPDAFLQCNRWRAELMAARLDILELTPAQREWPGLSALLERLPPTHRPHAHPELATFHLARNVGASNPPTK